MDRYADASSANLLEEEETWRRTSSGPAIVLRHGTVLTMDANHRVLTDADVLVVGDTIAAVGAGLEAPPGARGDRRRRRHRHARHDRHPPPPVADRDARLRRRLDADPVLRLVLPRARPHVPARGHLRGQPAGRDRGDRRRRDHDRRLVARAADRSTTRPPRSRPCRRCRPGSCWRTATSRRRPWEWTAQPEVRRFLEERRATRPTTGWVCSWPSTCTGDPVVPGAGGVRGGPRPRSCR